MPSSVVLSEHRATEENCVVGVKRDSPKRGRCGARLATHHRVCAGAVIEIHRSDFARAVIRALCVNACSCLKTDSNPSGPECVDVVGPVGLLVSGSASAQCRIGVCVGGAKVRGRERHRHCGSAGPGLLASVGTVREDGVPWVILTEPSVREKRQSAPPASSGHPTPS